VFPRYSAEAIPGDAPPAMETKTRLSIGVAGLDALFGGGLLERSVTLVSGSAGIGKSTLALQFALAGAKHNEHAIYASLEEGPAQLIGYATALGLPLEKAVAHGLVETLFLSGNQFRAPQLLTILEAHIREKSARRLVLDGVTHLLARGVPIEELRQLLYELVARLKRLGVTTIFTLESKSIFVTGSITDLDLSPVSDNLVMLRYIHEAGELQPTLSVVKTRGSVHDRGTYAFTIAKGGIRIGARVGAAPTRAEKAKRTKKRSRPR
jgi:circadian clock protein KaiC